MRVRRFAFGILAALLASQGAWAHGGRKHGGASLEGSIEEVATESFTLATERGAVPVTLTKETAIVSEDGKALGRDSLQPGVHVVVGGHKLPGGGVAAVEVTVHAKGSQPGAAGPAGPHR